MCIYIYIYIYLYIGAAREAARPDHLRPGADGGGERRASIYY